MSSGPYLRDPFSFEGRVEMRPFKSAALAKGRVGDPCEREVPVYLPPGHDAPGVELPVVFILVGFTGRAQSQLDTHPWRRGLVSRYDRAVSEGNAPPAILVLPDAFTRYGGSQYVNSSLLGNYEDYVAEELTTFVDEHYPTLEGRRALVGKSSGGFGALHLGMRHPKTFPVVASISGDCHFEYGYASEFLTALRKLQTYGGRPRAFLEEFWERPKLDGDGHALINLLAMSACYSPNAESPNGFDLPIDTETGIRIPEVWQRWLSFDPVIACEEHASALKELEFLHLEAGVRDEFHLQFGLRILIQKLDRLGVPFEHEEHPGGHFDLDARYDLLLPKLIRKLAEG